MSSPRAYSLLRRNSTLVGDNTTPRRKSLVSVRVAEHLTDPGPDAADSEPEPEPEPELESGAEPVRTSEWARDFLTSPDFQVVLKCSLGYFLGSLFVYVPLLSRQFGRTTNKHMIATVTVYFHAGRTVGSMLQTMLYVAPALMLSLATAALSIQVKAWLIACNLPTLAIIVDLTVFCAGGLGLIAFFKQKVNKPAFNTACTLASMFLVMVLTKDARGPGSGSGLGQTFVFVLTGAVIAHVVCFAVWPQTAHSVLKAALAEAMDINASLLTYISETFLHSQPVDSPRYRELTGKLSTALSKIDTALIETQYELYVTGRAKEYAVLGRLVALVASLSAHLGGLAASAKIQSFLAVAGEPEANLHDQAQPRPDVPAQRLFDLFLVHLSPSFLTYTYGLNSILSSLHRTAIEPSHVSRLRDLLALFSQARENAVRQVYAHAVFQSDHPLAVEQLADEEGVAAGCGNFSYVLEAYGRELQQYVDVLQEYEALKRLPPVRSYSWLYPSRAWFKQEDSPEPANRLVDILIHRTGTKNSKESAAHDSASALSSPSAAVPSLGLRLWQRLRLLRRADVRFGIKVGLGAAIFALPAFVPPLQSFFGEWRGQWGLVTYAAIMNKTVGGTAMTMRSRFTGTLLGAVTAYVLWFLFPSNQYMLALAGWLLALPCFWIILHNSTNNALGRFILLTFNLTALYSYSLSIADDDDDDADEGGVHPIVAEIAFHRFVSVFAGAMWALFVTMAIMPYNAQRKLRESLCVQWLRMGLVWKADAMSSEQHVVVPYRDDPEAQVANSNSMIHGIQDLADLQRAMGPLRTLLKQAPMEFRLKGPFPTRSYQALVQSTQEIVDAFHNMDVLVAKNRYPSMRERLLIAQTAAERKELCSRIFLFFYLASSAVTLGFPLPDKLPSTDHALDRMLAKLNEQRHDSSDDDDDEDYVLFYSYILVTVTVTEELSKIALELQKLYGVFDAEMFEQQ